MLRVDLGVIRLTLKYDGSIATYLDALQEVNSVFTYCLFHRRSFHIKVQAQLFERRLTVNAFKANFKLVVK